MKMGNDGVADGQNREVRFIHLMLKRKADATTTFHEPAKRRRDGILSVLRHLMG